MPKPTANFDTIRKIGLALPGVEESVAWGTPVLKVHVKIFAGIAIHSSAEPGSLMVRMAPEDRDELISAAPEVYYVTDHYVQGNGVLVRLSRANADMVVRSPSGQVDGTRSQPVSWVNFVAMIVPRSPAGSDRSQSS